MMKAERETVRHTRSRHIRLTANFTTETMKVRRAKEDIHHVIEDNYYPQLLYPTKLPAV